MVFCVIRSVYRNAGSVLSHVPEIVPGNVKRSVIIKSRNSRPKQTNMIKCMRHLTLYSNEKAPVDSLNKICRNRPELN
jgi:hypothetical protein